MWSDLATPLDGRAVYVLREIAAIVAASAPYVVFCFLQQRQQSSDSIISATPSIKVRKTSGLSCDSDIVAFCDMMKALRGEQLFGLGRAGAHRRHTGHSDGKVGDVLPQFCWKE